MFACLSEFSYGFFEIRNLPKQYSKGTLSPHIERPSDVQQEQFPSGSHPCVFGSHFAHTVRPQPFEVERGHRPGHKLHLRHRPQLDSRLTVALDHDGLTREGAFDQGRQVALGVGNGIECS